MTSDQAARMRKSFTIELLEGKIADLEAQNTALQAHNTELLLRARTAEVEVRRLKFVLGDNPSYVPGPEASCGRQGGSCQCTSVEECIAK